MNENGQIQVIPISEEYRRNYDRIFRDDKWFSGREGLEKKLPTLCCHFNVSGSLCLDCGKDMKRSPTDDTADRLHHPTMEAPEGSD